jgi:hypothetical protein
MDREHALAQPKTKALIRNKKTFNLGMILAISFVGVLLLIFSPIFGGGKNGLEYSDELFNKLSKGSSYFIPAMSEKAQKFVGKPINVSVKVDDQAQGDKAVKIFLAAGAQVGIQGSELKINADLGKLLGNVLQDSDAMFNNNGEEVKARYEGMDEKEVMSVWWATLSKSIKELQKQKNIDEAGVISDVLKKGVEPAFNFYHVEAQNIGDKAFTVLGLLAFYVAYTMWWGYAIFYLFDGLGLSMKKAKVKKEV